MNVFILYCNTGGGHNSAGKALQEELELRGHHADMVDTYTIVSDRLAEWLGHSYDHMVQRAPILWCMFYQIRRFRSSLPFSEPSSPCTNPDRVLETQTHSRTDYNQVSGREADRQLAAKQLGLDPDRHYLLLSGGCIGAGKIWTAAKTIAKYLKIHPAYDLIIICGNNDRLYEKLKKHYQNNAQICLMRHTDQMAAYMRACDVLISKPGGLTSTEAAVCGVPLIHISPIPGRERKNAEFFAQMGMSLYPKNCRRQLTSVLRQLEDPVTFRHMIRQQQQEINSRAAADICDFVEQIVQTEGRTANCSGEKPRVRPR